MTESITCPRCGMTSHHPTDVAESYCGNCHTFIAEPTIQQYGDPRGKNATWTLMPAAKGLCSQCGVNHEPEEPHDVESLRYQYVFFSEHGRWPTWSDALAHCDESVQELWRTLLRERGVSENQLRPS